MDETDAYANLVLPGLLRERRIVGRDAAFATELTYGTLRMRGLLDAVLGRCANRSVKEIDANVFDVLRLGAYQLLEMRVPSHAAVSTTVDLARSTVGQGRSSFVNAVLRRVTEHDRAHWVAEVTADMNESDAMAVEHSHPRWVVDAFRDALGGSLDDTALLLEAENAPAPVTLTARWCDADELLAAGATPSRWLSRSVRITGDPGQLAAVRDQRAGVQDEGSALVATALSRVPIEGPDVRWLDLCAGPGGKSALLAAEGDRRQSPATVTAVEVQPHRADLVRNALSPSSGAHEVVCADGRDDRFANAGFDRVLVDAPCTGLGALRRRPEARWRRQPSDLGGLGTLQRELLTAGIRATRAGGVVGYVTCSPHLSETRAVIADVMKRQSHVTVLDAREYLPELTDLGEGPFVQLWPHRHDTDAMFLAMLRVDAA